MWGLLNETLNRNIRKQSTHEFSLNNKTTIDHTIMQEKYYLFQRKAVLEAIVAKRKLKKYEIKL